MRTRASHLDRDESEDEIASLRANLADALAAGGGRRAEVDGRGEDRHAAREAVAPQLDGELEQRARAWKQPPVAGTEPPVAPPLAPPLAPAGALARLRRQGLLAWLRGGAVRRGEGRWAWRRRRWA